MTKANDEEKTVEKLETSKNRVSLSVVAGGLVTIGELAMLGAARAPDGPLPLGCLVRLLPSGQ